MRRRYNPKRQIHPNPSREQIERLKSSVKYQGSPYHKRNPGDFGLEPPAAPRPDKTLCDEVGVFSRDEAQRLMIEGIERGLISRGMERKFPRNIWSVTADGRPLEARLDNPSLGTYHGYPLPASDPFGLVVMEKWRDR